MKIHEIQLNLHTLEGMLYLEINGETVNIPVGALEIQRLIHTATLNRKTTVKTSTGKGENIIYYSFIEKN